LSTPQKLRLAQRHLGQVDPRFTPIIATILQRFKDQ